MLGSGFFSILRFGSRQNPPREDYQQRTEEGGDKVFKGNLQLAKPEIDSEKLNKLAAKGRADHADQQVCPATQAFLFQRNSPPRERAGETAYNNPHDNLTNVHITGATTITTTQGRTTGTAGTAGIITTTTTTTGIR